MNFDIAKYIQILQLNFLTLLDKKYWIITSLHVKDPVSLGGGPEAGAGGRRTLRHPHCSVHRNHSDKLREKPNPDPFFQGQNWIRSKNPDTKSL